MRGHEALDGEDLAVVGDLGLLLLNQGPEVLDVAVAFRPGPGLKTHAHMVVQGVQVQQVEGPH